MNYNLASSPDYIGTGYLAIKKTNYRQMKLE